MSLFRLVPVRGGREVQAIATVAAVLALAGCSDEASSTSPAKPSSVVSTPPAPTGAMKDCLAQAAENAAKGGKTFVCTGLPTPTATR